MLHAEFAASAKGPIDDPPRERKTAEFRRRAAIDLVRRAVRHLHLLPVNFDKRHHITKTLPIMPSVAVPSTVPPGRSVPARQTP